MRSARRSVHCTMPVAGCRLKMRLERRERESAGCTCLVPSCIGETNKEGPEQNGHAAELKHKSTRHETTDT